MEIMTAGKPPHDLLVFVLFLPYQFTKAPQSLVKTNKKCSILHASHGTKNAAFFMQINLL